LSPSAVPSGPKAATEATPSECAARLLDPLDPLRVGTGAVDAVDGAALAVAVTVPDAETVPLDPTWPETEMRS
jgi:hypothetical protein